MWDLLLHGQDQEQNFTKFFTELRAAGTAIGYSFLLIGELATCHTR